MTRKLVLVNMSDTENEYYQVTELGELIKLIPPGGYVVLNTYRPWEITDVVVGESTVRKPPKFPRDVIERTEDQKS